MLGGTPNQTTKFRTKDWIEINYDSRGTYNINSQIKFKTSMLRSVLSDFSYAYIIVTGTITVTALVAGRGNNNIQVVFENCAPFINSICKINSTQIR